MKTNQSLADLIALCKDERGTKSKVLRLLNAKRAQKITWAQLSGWLHPDNAERVEPRLSVGIELLAIQDKLCGPQEQPTKGTP